MSPSIRWNDGSMFEGLSFSPTPALFIRLKAVAGYNLRV